ncbi:MAG TPA: sensory rhodopsin transducer [Verrucomicrobiae bacterium]|nr:sensory rhodopsin transducer [Verrucomicrobiae bacterium]
MNPLEQKKFAPLGHKRWAVAEGYIPETSHGPEPQMTSHESICVLNVSDEEAHLQIWIFYADRDPVGPYQAVVAPRRTKHLRFNNFTDPEPIPRGTDFSSIIESNVRVVVQHTRLDSRQAENALISTIAFADTESVM